LSAGNAPKRRNASVRKRIPPTSSASASIGMGSPDSSPYARKPASTPRICDDRRCCRNGWTGPLTVLTTDSRDPQWLRVDSVAR
jgi:hypothetical protein